MRFAVIPGLPAAGRRSDESLFDQDVKKREIPHPSEAHGAQKPRFADSVPSCGGQAE